MKIALVARIYRPHYIISKNKSQHVIVDSYASESVNSCIFEIALANAAAMTHAIENFGRHRPLRCVPPRRTVDWRRRSAKNRATAAYAAGDVARGAIG